MISTTEGFSNLFSEICRSKQQKVLVLKENWVLEITEESVKTKYEGPPILKLHIVSLQICNNFSTYFYCSAKINSTGFCI